MWTMPEQAVRGEKGQCFLHSLKATVYGIFLFCCCSFDKYVEMHFLMLHMGCQGFIEQI